MFYVARPYSHTDLRCLWKIESRGQPAKSVADNWCDFLNTSAVDSKERPCPHRGTYFVLEVPDDANAP